MLITKRKVEYKKTFQLVPELINLDVRVKLDTIHVTNESRITLNYLTSLWYLELKCTRNFHPFGERRFEKLENLRLSYISYTCNMIRYVLLEELDNMHGIGRELEFG